MTENAPDPKPRAKRRPSRYLLMQVKPEAKLLADGDKFTTPKAAWAWAEESNVQGTVMLLNVREVRDCASKQLWLAKKVVG